MRNDSFLRLDSVRVTHGLPDDSRIVQAMEEYLCRLEAGERPDRQLLLEQYPEFEDRLNEFLDGLEFVHAVAPQIQNVSGDLTPRVSQPLALGDFRIVREIGRGGMGVVYEAEQLSLGRRVALKVLPYFAVLDQKQLQRFKNEAQAAARLRHPNIVGVYFVGCDRGVHYYAMELIGGPSLAEVISDRRKAMESQAKPDAGAKSEAGAEAEKETLAVSQRVTFWSASGRNHCRSMVELGVQAARALEYAHDFGVVHRDIKPSNLLVDADGHVWITDYGLAMTLADSDLTLTGDLLGTPRYMSPEQAAGNRVLTDHRTDIYSLGVTLYELLSLRAPFEGTHRQNILRDIIERDPPALHQVCRGIPRDLETILLKAMAKEPAERYQTAREFGADLQRFLDDEPIRARRPGFTRRLAKWSRRHRRPLAAVLSIAAVMLITGAVLLWRQRDQTLEALAQARENFQVAENQRLEAEHQRHRAEDNFRRQQKMLEELLMGMAINLTDVPQSEHVQATLLEHALVNYQEFLQESPTDPQVRFDTAQAHVRIAEAAERLARHEQQGKACREAVDLLTHLLQESPNDVDYMASLVRAHTVLGRYNYSQRNTKQAEEQHRQALRIAKDLVLHDDPHGFYRNSLASSHTYLGFALASHHNDPERFEEGITEMRKGLLLREQLVLKTGRFKGDLAQSHRLIGKQLSFHGRTTEAEPHLLKAADLLGQAIEQFPDITNYRFSLATLQFQMGGHYLRLGRPLEAASAFVDSSDLRETLLHDFPTMQVLRRELGEGYELLGEALISSGQPQEAEDAFRKSIAVRQELADGLVQKHVGLAGISWCHHDLALVFQAADRPQDAEREFRQVITMRQKLVDEYPDKNNYKRHLAWGYFELGLLMREEERWDEASELFQSGLRSFEEVMAGAKPSLSARRWFISFLTECPDDRFQDAERAVTLTRDLLSEIPSSAETWNSLGLAFYRAESWEEAVEAFDKSTELRSAEQTPVPCHQWLFQAAALWHMGNATQGREVFEQTFAWMRANQHNERYHELRRWLPEVREIFEGADE